ncbi:hypothetical protein CZ787_18040 [Halomonas citrativorans]|uniref:Uncharacterized protein n=1 Tax=Halomonas citrativorans TaxID=2742612 RepID=A0A1R4I5D0_9GAMM|nr:hypothetical protein [Halomonas citrativorans]SJN15015.1 hypothetical protein CZ787_18040 [Halomonas citrativorans]
MKTQQTMLYALLLGGALLTGCAGNPPAPEPEALHAVDGPVSQTGPAANTHSIPDTDWVPPLYISPEEEASYYVSRLSDRRFVSYYGDRDNRRAFYIAAERLGDIGLPAVPLLYARLNTQDEYEQMLVLYALQLATQDPLLTSKTSGDYVQLPSVLSPESNAENVVIAQQWWQRNAGYLN